MMPFVVTALFAFIIYLFLSAGTGNVGLWSVPELVAGIVISLIAGGVSRVFFAGGENLRMANPLRWIILCFYAVIPFFIEMARANLDVAYRVITGRIRPGIVRYSPGLETDLGILLLANSITLTPGTLTVDLDEKTGDLFVHMLNIRKGSEKKKVFDSGDIFSLTDLSGWVRRIAE